MTKTQRIVQLERLGFNRTVNHGSRYACFRLGDYNVDVGPRGGVSCWCVTYDRFSDRVTSTRVGYDDVLRYASGS